MDKAFPAQVESPVTRSGHEFLTYQSAEAAKAKEPAVFGRSTVDIASVGKCRAGSACRHRASDHRVWSAILGARWADLMGFRAGPHYWTQEKCMEAVAQDNEDVQYDHALRKRADSDTKGGMNAVRGIRERLGNRFLEAVSVADDNIPIADGGAQQDHFVVNGAFFRFGRALHIVQDSFSAFHTTRSSDYTQILQVNSYVCSPGAPVHPHQRPTWWNVINKDYGAVGNGDYIWSGGGDDEKKEKSDLKIEYSKAVDACRDLWLAFLRVRSESPASRAVAANKVIAEFNDRWMRMPAVVEMWRGELDCKPPNQPKLEDTRKACLNQIPPGSVKGEPPFDWDRGTFDDVP